MKNIIIAGLLILILAVVCLPLWSADSKQPAAETQKQKDARMKWWRDARFGLFIHWGLYSIPAGQWDGKQIGGGGEWIMETARIPVNEYEKLAGQFNPVKFDADQWVRLAKDAGMKYIVITSKHHDGFCLWDSKVSSYDIIDAAPFKRDVLKELSKACRKHKIKLCFYHSIMDWHHPDAQAPHYPTYNTSQKKNPNFSRYVENYLKPQINELIAGYGPLGVLWFDGEWIPEWNQEYGKDMYRFVRGLQPDIIINNRVSSGRMGLEGMTEEGSFSGDFGTPEQQIPSRGLPGVDWESCMTMNDTWGYKSFDNDWKSTQQLVRNLVDIASKGGNYLLNVGPTSEGIIPQPSVERLKEIGQWMKVNGESIYETGPSVFKNLSWGRCTTKKGTLYLHVFDWPSDGKLNVPGLKNTVKKAYLLSDKREKKLAVKNLEDSVVIDVPAEAPDKIDTVIVVQIKGEPQVVSPVISQKADGMIELLARDADVVGLTARYEFVDGKDDIGYWTNPADYVRWTFKVNKTGTFDIHITYASDRGAAGCEYIIETDGQQVGGTVKETGSWTNYVTENIGRLSISKTGVCTLDVKVKKMSSWAVMSLQSVKLAPADK